MRHARWPDDNTNPPIRRKGIDYDRAGRVAQRVLIPDHLPVPGLPQWLLRAIIVAAGEGETPIDKYMGLNGLSHEDTCMLKHIFGQTMSDEDCYRARFRYGINPILPRFASEWTDPSQPMAIHDTALRLKNRLAIDLLASLDNDVSWCYVVRPGQPRHMNERFALWRSIGRVCEEEFWFRPDIIHGPGNYWTNTGYGTYYHPTRQLMFGYLAGVNPGNLQYAYYSSLADDTEQS